MVQATYFEQPTDAGPRRVIHVLNEVSSFGRASLPKGALPLREEVIPVPGVRVRISAPAGRIHLEPGGVDLKPGPEEEGSLTVELPPLGLHQMVVVEAG